MKPVLSLLCSLLLIGIATPLLADSIELTNGDVLNGEVMSLDGQQVIFKSEVHGEMKIERAKVSAILFGERKHAQTAPATPVKSNPAQTPDEVVQQLQKQGIDPTQMKALQQQFPLLGTPEAQGYFNEMLGGLMSGERNIGDLRKDAIYARDQLKDLQDELGPEGAALNGYMSILNRFIEQTEPTSPPQNPREKSSTPDPVPAPETP